MSESVRILWLDPDTSAVAASSDACIKRGWAVDRARTVQEALVLARSRAYHFAIVDVMLPDGMGTEAWVRFKELHPDLSGIMTTGSIALRTSIQTVGSGILAYLVKPLVMEDVCGLIATVCEHQSLPARRDGQLPGDAGAVSGAEHAAAPFPVNDGAPALADQESIADQDSGVYSAAFLEHVLAMESARQTREFRPFSLVLVNWSGVRQVYRTLGPEIAAGALRKWGGLARRVVRKSDVVARREGDEFAILLPDTDSAQAQLVAQRIEAHTAATLPDTAQQVGPVLTFDFVTYPPNGK